MNERERERERKKIEKNETKRGLEVYMSSGLPKDSQSCLSSLLAG
jgi:hypothetical protein